MMLRWYVHLRTARERALLRAREGGFSTAEGLAGAALAIGALVVIWAAMKALGVEVVDWIRGQIIKG
ncbi:MAG TPA: hypothetical protein VGM21_20765 [Actinomycetota bacterium]|jgi:hypothetical protein